MNPVVNSQLKEFMKSNPGEFSSESEYFEVMSIFSVENGILSENIDPFKAHLKGNEFGLDGIAITIQGSLCSNVDEANSILSVGSHHLSEFHFYQSKISEGMDYGDISKFLDAVYDFFTELNLLSGSQIEDLSEVKDSIYAAPSKSNPNLKCYYCTTGTGEISKLILNLISERKSKLEYLNIFNKIEINCFGAKQIQSGFRLATNSTSATINFSKVLTLPIHKCVDEAYIGFIQADQLLSIALTTDTDGVKRINRSVFYDNVRDFNPDSEINKSVIKELADGDYSSFIFKNNGVTVVAKSINRKGDAFTIEDYQIVNGCQTTNILASAIDYSSSISVPFRLIGSKDIDFVSAIIVGTNKQNEVRDDQFWALRPFMKDLEEYCCSKEGEEKVLIERRDNQYRDISVERTRIIKSSDLMKAAAAMFLYLPNRAARDHRGIRQEFDDKIFLPTHSVELYHLAAFAFYKFDYLIRTSRVDRTNSIYKFYCLFALIRKNWAQPNILVSTKRNQAKVQAEAHKIVMDNDLFVTHIESVSKSLNKILLSTGTKTREQIRDSIRSETICDQFVKDFF
jgi:hypothetical protein